jgi:hypothetical protein
MSDSFLFTTTELALEILLAGTKKTLDNKVLTIDESKVVGKAMGWLALMTVNTENDIFAEYIVALKELNAAMMKNRNTSMMSNRKTNNIPRGTLITAYGGAYRKRKMRGGIPPLLAIVMGALTVLWGGNTGYTLYELNNHRQEIRTSGIQLINSACPASLALGPPSRPVFVGYFSAEHQRQLTQYEQDTITCNTAKQTVAVRVRDAETRFATAMDNIPKQVGLLTTATVLAVSGPVAPASIGAATTIGSSVTMVVSTVMSGTLPQNQSQMSALTTALSTGFPALPTPPPPPPPGGGKRRSTRRSRKSRKLTRRR